MRAIDPSRFLLLFGVNFSDDFLLANVGDDGVGRDTGQRGQTPTAVPTVSAVLSMPNPGNDGRCW